jgi:DHA1 family bicyclomycin/chloramphenicol resistance-like MFS transporter
LVSMIFSLSPALAPVFGGWVVTLFTWRAIFLTLFAYAVAMLMLCLRGIDASVLLLLLSHLASPACSSTSLRCQHELGLPPTEYAVMFVPIVAGIVLGSLATERLAGRVASTRLILAGLSIQLVTGMVNVTFLAMHAVSMPGSVLPLGLYAFGMSLATPGLILVGLDQFPQMRGLASSCLTFGMVLLAGLVTQLAPTFGGRAIPLGLVQGALCMAAFAPWLVTIRPYQRNG